MKLLLNKHTWESHFAFATVWTDQNQQNTPPRLKTWSVHEVKTTRWKPRGTVPVPRLVGQAWMNPYLASSMKSFPDSFFTLSPTAWNNDRVDPKQFFLIRKNWDKKILTITKPIFKLDVGQTGLSTRVFTKILECTTFAKMMAKKSKHLSVFERVL